MKHHMKASLGSLHTEWFKLIDHPRLCFSAPRGFAKTTFWTVFYVLFKVLAEGPCNVVIVSSSSDMAESSLRDIKMELDSNPDIYAQYGDQTSKTWRNDQIILKNGSHIWAKGQGTKIRGTRPRPDLIIIDDIENDKNVTSEDIQLDIIKWFKNAVEPALFKEGQLIMLGTRLHPMSFLSRFIDKDVSILSDYFEWEIREYRARNEEGKSVWKEWYSDEWLDNKEKSDPSRFQQEWMNNPIPDSERPFKPEFIQYYKELPKNLSYTTTVDPAATTGKHSDYTAIVTVGTDSKGTMYIADAIRGRFEPDEIIEQIFQQYLRYGSRTIAIEEVAFSNMLRKQLEKEMLKRRLPLNVIPLKKDNSSLGVKKRLRIEGLQPHIKAGWLLFSKAHRELETELLCYPGRHDDLLDALAYQLDVICPASKGNPTKEYYNNAPPNSYLHWKMYTNKEKYKPGLRSRRRKVYHK